MKKYSENINFFKTSIFKEFNDLPINFIDIGARGSFFNKFSPVSDITSVYAFEPDKEEIESLKKKEGKNWKNFKLFSLALGENKNKTFLFSCVAPTNSSIFKPNPKYIRRYNMEKWKVKSKKKVTLDKLDSLLNQSANKKKIGEFIKIDTQGSEFEILKGAKKILKNHTIGVITEVSFLELYKNQKLFSDIEMFLRKQNFYFFGFETFHNRSKGFLSKDKYNFKERLMQTNAIFFKDPFEQSFLDKRKIRAICLSTMINGFFDFSLEISKRFLKEDYNYLKKFIKEIATVDIEKEIFEVNRLNDIVSKNPSQCLRNIGKFVDERRINCDFKDVFKVKV